MIHDLFRRLGETAVGDAMRDSTWGFAIVETIHLVALAALGGAILVVNLTALRLLFRRQSRAEVASALQRLTIGALATMLVSGALLVSSKPVRYYLDDTFRAKMALLLIAILASIAVHRRMSRNENSILLKALAAVSLTLWLGVGICGRLIGFL